MELSLNFSRRLWLLSLVAFSAAGAWRSSAADESAPPAKKSKVRIVLVGDSTVTDDAGWGKGFKAHLAPPLECINSSAGGRSSKSYRDEGKWTKALALKPAYVLIQFGHNDEPGKGPLRETDPDTTYAANMARYVDEARKAGAKPVLVTSIARRSFDSHGKAVPGASLMRYVEAVKRVAAEKKVPLMDLQTQTLKLYSELGKKGCEEKISPLNKGAIDGTHLNAEGSKLVGALAAEEFRKAVPELAAFVK